MQALSKLKDGTYKFSKREYLHPIQLVRYLDEYIVGQDDAKKAISIALRSRYRRLELKGSEIFKEIKPNNILFIGDTGVGKTEIIRRVAESHDFPFIKVDATKYTEIGYVGHDVESIIKDLVENRLRVLRSRLFEVNHENHKNKVMKIILDTLVKQNSSYAVLERKDLEDLYKNGGLDDVKILISLPEKKSNKSFLDMMDGSSSYDSKFRPASSDSIGSLGIFAIADVVGFGSGLDKKSPKQHHKIKNCKELLLEDEKVKSFENEDLKMRAVKDVEESGVVFIDEIDKLITKTSSSRGEVSREGVQRDLIPLMSGSYVNTKYSSIKTDNILFVCAGAFHNSSPMDLIPELQGRMPVQIKLKPLSQKDFYKILVHPKFNIVKQIVSLLSVDGIMLEFTDCGLKEIAKCACDLNRDIRNTGARRLFSIIEKIHSDVGFIVPKKEQKFKIDKDFVQKSVKEMMKDIDIKKDNYVM